MFKIKKIITFTIVFILLLAISIVFIIPLTPVNTSLSKVVGEYDTSKLGNSFGNAEAYAIGANSKGMPVFKNPNKAFRQAIKDYKDGYKAIRKEFKLLPVNKLNYSQYSTYGCQITTGNDEEKRQGRIISQFFDIYENSF
jgi:type IV secretory pathway protease TraF